MAVDLVSKIAQNLLGKTMLALLYDWIVLLALFFLVTFLLQFFNQGKAIETTQILHTVHQLSLVLVGFSYYGWSWTRNGQTIGLRAWRLRLVTLNGRPVSWSQAAVRAVVALVSLAALGLGYWWMFVSPHQSWHDRASQTVLRSVTETENLA